MAIRIVTDSASDILPADAKKMGVTVMSLTVTFGDVTYKDCIDLDHFGFFEKLIETDELPKTSQLTPYEYEELFQSVLDEGDEVLYIALSSKLSGCFQSACIAAREFEKGVRIIDSENACIGERILVERAVQLSKEIDDLDKLADAIDREKKDIRLIALLDTLEYLKRGGRISSAAAIAGEILSIKPVIAVENGEVILLGKARGSKNGNNKLKELINKEGGINFEKPCVLAYSGLSRDLLDKYIHDSVEMYEGHANEIYVSTIGCAIGTHVGPGAIAAAFFI